MKTNILTTAASGALLLSSGATAVIAHGRPGSPPPPTTALTGANSSLPSLPQSYNLLNYLIHKHPLLAAPASASRPIIHKHERSVEEREVEKRDDEEELGQALPSTTAKLPKAPSMAHHTTKTQAPVYTPVIGVLDGKTTVVYVPVASPTAAVGMNGMQEDDSTAQAEGVRAANVEKMGGLGGAVLAMVIMALL